MTTLTLHKFEAVGLGQAPFSLVSVFDAGRVAECCDACGTGIRYQFWIRSFDGKNHKVGIDCIRKLWADNNQLLTDAERAMAKIEQEIRNAKAAAKWQKIKDQNEAILKAQRDANGGLTDSEIAENARKAKEEADQKAMASRNQWLITVLQGQRGDFVLSMIQSLHRSPVKDLSERCVRILADIYAKATGGRGGSKKWQAAYDEFFTKAEVEQ